MQVEPGIEIEPENNFETPSNVLTKTYDYFISLLKDETDSTIQRSIREEFSLNFPLSNELWLEWIDDELSAQEPDCDYLLPLLDKAARALNSPEIWNIYVDLSLVANLPVDDLKCVFDAALRCCGNHVNCSHILWHKARQFELPLGDESRINELFLGEISVPTAELEEVWNEYFEWAGGSLSSSALNKVNESRRLLKKLMPFEEQLSLEPTLSIFEEYLAANSHSSAAKRRQSLLERILSVFPLSEIHWALYIQLLISRYDSSAEYMKHVYSVVEQANIKCPGNPTFWVYRLQLINFSPYNTSDEFLVEKFTQILQSAFSVEFASSRDYCRLCMAALLFYRMRALDVAVNLPAVYEMCEYSRHFFESNYPADLVSWAEILLFTAKLYATTNLQKSREMCESVVTTDLRRHFRYWNDYYVIENAHGDLFSQRKVLRRAMACVRDHTQLIADIYLDFERINGDYSTYWLAVRRITEKSSKMPLKAAQPVNKFNKMTRKVDKSYENSNPPAKVKSPDNLPTNIHSAAKRKCPEDKNDFTGSDRRTVFVSNLSYSIREKEIIVIFSAVGEVTDVRLVGDDGERHRGYGYVEFSREESVQGALLLDRSPIGTYQRPMFVSAHGVSKEFQYSTDLDKCKLFVRNLPVEMDAAGLDEFLKDVLCGGVRAVRLVTRKNGKSKRVAYVDFHDEAAAQDALAVLDGRDVSGCVISAAFSNPPAKQSKEDFLINSKKSFATQKTRIDFVPRAIQRGKSEVMENKSNQYFRDLFNR